MLLSAVPPIEFVENALNRFFQLSEGCGVIAEQ